MKNKLVQKIGRLLMQFQPVSICIIDDVEAYFNENMLNLASVNGEYNFERWTHLSGGKLNDLMRNPRDIVILDIKGIVDKEIAKDGFDVARLLKRNTESYVVTTSAHQYHLKNRDDYGDFIITDRLMTPVDFVEQLNLIVEDFLDKKIRPYQRLFFRAGFKLCSKVILT